MREIRSTTAANGDRPSPEALRDIPSVAELVGRAEIAIYSHSLPRDMIVEAARKVVDAYRARILDGRQPTAPDHLASELAAEIVETLERTARPRLQPTINATGIIIHTGLGRAPLAREAAEAMASAAASYTPVELDMASGERGHRSLVVRDLLCGLTGAESATVVNNNAAALLIALGTVRTPDRNEIIVSRGELIEIGGSFRLPDVMEQSGARLREVGTTNKTRLADFESAINARTAAILSVHPSNYRIVGFTESPGVADLARLARAHSVPLLHDIGSGVLHDMSGLGLAGEPDARTSIRDGADLVLFSGDKLLGGPQAGIIVGRKALVSRIEKNPLMRALRVDKMTLGGLAATLQLHHSPGRAAEHIPVLRMLNLPLERVRKRAESLATALGLINAIERVEVTSEDSYLGGGSLPAQAIKSAGVRFRARSINEAEFARRLRAGSPAVLPRVQQGWVILDLRTVFEEQDAEVAAAIRAALEL
jgi:L-seryl-tRNA(Ser) seleniumtransferase